MIGNEDAKIHDFNEHTFDLDLAGARELAAYEAVEAHLPALCRGGDINLAAHCGLLYDLYRSFLPLRAEILRSAVYFEVHLIDLPPVSLIEHFCQNLASAVELVRTATIGGDATAGWAQVLPVIKMSSENAEVLIDLFEGAGKKLFVARNDCLRFYAENKIGGVTI